MKKKTQTQLNTERYLADPEAFFAEETSHAPGRKVTATQESLWTPGSEKERRRRKERLRLVVDTAFLKDVARLADSVSIGASMLDEADADKPGVRQLRERLDTLNDDVWALVNG